MIPERKSIGVASVESDHEQQDGSGELMLVPRVELLRQFAVFKLQMVKRQMETIQM